MKDKQISPASAEPRIPFVSAFLHCVSMSALVYLRFSFGFGFLRPKAIFLAVSWAFILYTIYAWIDGTAWQQYHAVLLFGIISVVLYWLHLLIAFVREWNQIGEHENYSGKSHPVWLMRRLEQMSPAQFEAKLHLWAEPAAVLFVSAVLRLIFAERALSKWLLLVAVCIWSKEALNHWFHIRQSKRQRDAFDDTGESVEPPKSTNLAAELPVATRQARIRRTRSSDDSVSEAKERREPSSQ